MPWGWQVYLRGIAPGCHKLSKFGSIWNDSTHMAKKLGIFYATCLWQLYHIIVFGKTLQVPWWCEDSIAITARWVSPVLTVDSTGSRAHLLCEPQTSTDHAEKKGVPSEWERFFAGCGAMMSNDAVLDPYSSRSVVQGKTAAQAPHFPICFLYLNFDNFVFFHPNSVDRIFVD